MDQNQIRKKIIELADPKYKQFHQNLCPGIDHIIGVRVPVLRKFAKEIVQKEDWRQYLKSAKQDYYEEIMLQGMVIGLVNGISIKELCQLIEEFVPKINNWAICDTFCAGLKMTKKYPDEMWLFLKKYLASDKEFEIRFAVVMLLDHYIKEEYIDEVLKILEGVHHDGYYVKMAVAWAISVCYIKFFDQTMQYMKRCYLDDFTYNKALQKTIESYRIDENTKQILKQMKRK